MKKLDVKKDGQFCYSIFLTDTFDSIAKEGIGKELLEGRKACIVSDSTVAPLYLEQVKCEISKACREVTQFVFEAGEGSKTLNTVKALYEHLILQKLDRKDILIALGGGVVGDLTGFAAATYLRGIDFIQIPTTLLSQVDSSIGGKTGVDFDAYKNMVGAFHMPRMVYMNLNVLKTLSDRQFACGMAEIIKHGLIKNAPYYRWLKEHKAEVCAKEFDALLTMVEESCKVKRDVVEKDPTEKGDRALLNFGHTAGHAVEKMKDFELMHGECVAIGSVIAADLSCRRGEITEDELKDIKETFAGYGLPTTFTGLDPKGVVLTTKSDKKMEAGKIKFVLLHAIGDAYVSRDVTDEALEEVIAAALDVR